MNNRRGTLEAVGRHLAFAMQPLRSVVSDLDQFRSFMYRLGWNVTELPPEYTQLASNVDAIFDQLESLGDEPDPLAVATLFAKIRALYDEIQGVSVVPAGVAIGDQATFLSELREALLEVLLIDYMALELPQLHALLTLLGIIRDEDRPSTSSRPGHIRTHLELNRISEIIREPDRVPEFVYGWGTPELDFNLIAHHLDELLSSFGFLSRIEPPDGAVALGYGDPEQELSFLDSELKVPLFYTFVGPVPIEIGFELLELPGEDAELPGVILQPMIPEEIGSSLEISEGLSLRIRAGSELGKLFGVLIRPGLIAIRYPLDPDTPFPGAGFGIFFDYKPDEPALLLGRADASRIELADASTRFEMNFVSAQLEAILGADLSGLSLVLSSVESDGFVQKILGGRDVRIDIPLSLVWSNLGGIRFSGGGGFEVQLQPHLESGGVSINTVQIRAFAPAIGPKRIRTEIGASISGILGPLSFAVEGIGFALLTGFEPGNAGPFNISAGFKSPTGIGLSIDGGGFKGGGFLRFEPDHERYAGVLELEYQERIELKAIGLLTTRLSGGKPGFSLLIIITSEFTPIQLGLGFTLNGVGGLLGLNRTARVERLRTGLRDNTLSSILFPENIIANADRILSDLRQVFPPQDGRFLFGPMAKIGWGSPTLLTVDLGLLIEVPQPVRVFILGMARALLPDQEAKLLQLQVNFLGEIDFERELFAFDATLFDSKLLTYTLSGDMAVRMKWGDSDPNFLLTVGGFHPAYDPPPLGLPVLRRLTVQLLSGNNPRLTLETYFALTSNTAQFGARLELYAGAGKFNVYGFLSFDALFQFNPFYFIAEVAAMLALRVGSKSIASIQLALTLEGTTPWKARGTATLKLCWFIKIKVRFNKRFGEERDTRLDDVAVLPLLQTALSDKSNWAVGIPSGRHLLVSVKEIEGLGDQVVAHPFGILEISQRVVPLNVEVQTFGNQRPADGNRFAIEQVRVGEPGDTETLDTSSVQEQFAPAQFFEMSDAERLSSKSFERYDAGVRVTDSERLQAAYAAKRDVDYELFYIDSQRDQRLRPWFEPLRPEAVAFNAWASRGAVAASPLSFANTAKSALAPEAVRVSQEPFAVVNTSDLTLVRDDAVAFSEVGAFGLMRELIRSNPALEGEIQVVPAFEVNRS